MKIGFFIPNATFDQPGNAEVGGIEVMAFELAEEFHRRGHEVCLFGATPRTGKSHRPTPVRLYLNPCWETRQIPNWGSRFRKLVQRLQFASSSRSDFLKADCEVVFIFKPYDFINAWRWKRWGWRGRVIMNFQGTDFFPCDRLFLGAVDGFFAASASNEELARKRYGRTFPVLVNGVDGGVYVFDPAAKSSGTETRLAVSARLVGWKGMHILMEALQDIMQAYPTVVLDVCGDGPEKGRLETMAQSLSAPGTIQFRGVLPPVELRKILGSCDVFIQPSVGFDACPVAVLEAAASGCALVLSDQVGTAGVFQSGQACEQVKAGDAKELTRVLQKLLKDRERCRQLQVASRRVFEETFSLARMVDRLEKEWLA